MTLIRNRTVLVAVAVCLLCGSSVCHAEPPQQLYLDINRTLDDSTTEDSSIHFVKKSSWHESLRASLEATFGRSLSIRPDEEAGEFRPAMVQLTATGRPIRLQFPIAGVQRLYFATVGPPDVRGSASFIDVRLIDQAGKSTMLTLGSPMLEGQPDSNQAHDIEVTSNEITYSGFALAPGELCFQLQGQYTRLELLVQYFPQFGLPPYVAVDCQPIVARAQTFHEKWLKLWDRVARSFPDAQSQTEMELERRDGLWNEYTLDWKRDTRSYYLQRTSDRLKLAEKTLEFVQRSVPRPVFATAIQEAWKQLDQISTTGNAADARRLFAQAVDLRRRIIFSHPLLDFDQLLFTKRPTPVLSAPGDNYYGMNNGSGPGLVRLDNWKGESPLETHLLEDQLPPGCAMHPDLSVDGTRVVFSFADHTVPRELRQFLLYEIGIDGSALRQLTGTPADPMLGAGGRMTVMCEDYDPCYLPDGGIAFISTRNQGGVRCHYGGRYCPTYLLYRCDANGSNIRQISFGEANEWDPVVLHDGRILWTRWDYINRPVIPTLGLWTIHPDGTSASHFFGNYTSNPCRICQARPIPDSHKVIATTAGHHTIHAGSLILIDRNVDEDGLSAISRLTPDANFPETEPHSPVSYSTPFPLSEDLFLASYCPDPYPGLMHYLPRRNGYGVYLIDTLGGRELIHRDPDTSCFAPIPVQPRQLPPVLSALDEITTHSNRSQTGTFVLQDVYQSTQGIQRGEIRWLRVNELIPQPTQRVPCSSRVNFEVLKRVVGTVPVDASGSVAFEAPAGVPLQFQALDENGMAIMTMRTFTHLQPGETASCVGCHEPRSSTPHDQGFLHAPQVLKLRPPAGPRYPGGLSFAKTVQPVLDRYCIECHGLREVAGDIDLVGTMDASDQNIAESYHRLLSSVSYESLTRDAQRVSIAQYGAETWYSQPRDYFAHGGTLAQLLLAKHEGVELDTDSFQRIVDWLDLNAQLYGTYSWNKDEWRGSDPAGEQRLRQYIQQTLGAQFADQPFAALVNVGLPTESRILKAPLAVKAGGWGQIAVGGWESTTDPGYQHMLRLVRDAIQPLPFHDVAGTCGRDDDCRCLSCWVRRIQEERKQRLAASR
jgi:hypothetical protein